MTTFTRLTSISIFFVFLIVGVFMGRGSWDGVVFLSHTSSLMKGRTPAAIRKDLDFSKLSGDELITASQKRLVTAARVILEKETVGVELGHFVTRDENGDRQLACDFYDRMRLRFEADGIATSGEKPALEIEGPCRTSSDITRIEPIWIPVQRILGEKANDMDLTFPDQDGVNFRFRNMSGEWPMRWNLQSVRLYNDRDGGREVSIAGEDLRDLRERPIVLAWPNNERHPTSH